MKSKCPPYNGHGAFTLNYLYLIYPAKKLNFIFEGKRKAAIKVIDYYTPYFRYVKFKETKGV